MEPKIQYLMSTILPTWNDGNIRVDRSHRSSAGRQSCRSPLNPLFGKTDSALISALRARFGKLTRSFAPDRWLADAAGPDHCEPTRQALAEAVALVAYGRSPAGRTGLTHAVAGEPGLAEPWLRSLVTDLSRRR